MYAVNVISWEGKAVDVSLVFDTSEAYRIIKQRLGDRWASYVEGRAFGWALYGPLGENKQVNYGNSGS